MMGLTKEDRDWIEGHIDSLRRSIVDLQIEVAKLKVKAGIWGGIGAAVVVIGAMLLRK